MRGRSGEGGHGYPNNGGNNPGSTGGWRGNIIKGGGSGGRSGTHGRNCREEDDNGYTRIGKGNGGGGVTGGPVAPVGMNGAGRRIKDRSIKDRRYTGRNHVATNNKGTESRGNLSRCSGMEPHHPIISKLWDLGGQT